MLERPLALGALVALSVVVLACGSEMGDCPPQEAPAPPAAVAGDEGGPADSVASEGGVDVEVSVGASDPAQIECEADRIPKIHVESRGRTVRVWTDPAFDAPGESACKVKLSVGSLRELEVSGSGDVRVMGRADGLEKIHATGSGNVTVEEVSARSMQVVATGSGDVDLKRVSAGALALSASGSGGLRVGGSSERAKLSSNGSGDIDASDLHGEEVAVLSSGSGDVTVSAARKVAVDANGSGDVMVSGRPESRTIHKSGSGEIVFQ